MAGGEPLENILEIGVRLDAIELGGRDQRTEHRPMHGAAIRSREPVILAAQCDRANGARDGIVVDLDAAVVEEAAERRPAREGVADGLSEGTVGWDPGQILLQPDLQGFD